MNTVSSFCFIGQHSYEAALGSQKPGTWVYSSELTLGRLESDHRPMGVHLNKKDNTFKALLWCLQPKLQDTKGLYRHSQRDLNVMALCHCREKAFYYFFLDVFS